MNWCNVSISRTMELSLSLQGRKFTHTPKFLGTAEAYSVCHIGPIFQISLIYAFIGCSYFIVRDMKDLSYLLYPRGPFEATTSFSDLAIPPPVWPDLGSAPEAASADHDFLALLKALFCCWCCAGPPPPTWAPDWSTWEERKKKSSNQSINLMNLAFWQINRYIYPLG